MNDIFVYPLQNSKEYKDIINCINNNKGSLLINGLLAVQKPHIAYSMYRDLNRQTIFITNSDLEAKKVYDDLSFYMKDKVEYIGFQDILFYHLDAKDRSEEAKRLKVLLKLAKGENIILVTSIEAVMRKYIPKEILLENIYTYKIGDVINLEKLSETLVNLGYERVSKSYKIYKNQQDTIPRSVFLNVIKGNVGKVIAEEFISFVESDCSPLISYEDVFSCETLSSSVIEKVKSESHTRLYLSAMNILKTLELNFENDDISENNINRFIEFLKSYPVDLMVGIMKDIKSNYINVYNKAIENEEFVELYFESYSMIRG